MKSVVSEACAQHRGDEFLPYIFLLSYLARLRHDRRVNFLVYLEAKKGEAFENIRLRYSRIIISYDYLNMPNK